jgi:hypothetical protein
MFAQVRFEVLILNIIEVWFRRPTLLSQEAVIARFTPASLKPGSHEQRERKRKFKCERKENYV